MVGCVVGLFGLNGAFSTGLAISYPTIVYNIIKNFNYIISFINVIRDFIGVDCKISCRWGYG